MSTATVQQTAQQTRRTRRTARAERAAAHDDVVDLVLPDGYTLLERGGRLWPVRDVYDGETYVGYREIAESAEHLIAASFKHDEQRRAIAFVVQHEQQQREQREALARAERRAQSLVEQPILLDAVVPLRRATRRRGSTRG